MQAQFIKKLNTRDQYLVSVLLVVLVATVCFGLSTYLGYRGVALVLLLTVSLIAVTFDILPVLVSATISAFIWDFFFIPPRFNLHVNGTEDTILLVMYFVIALISGVLTYKIRIAEKEAGKREEKANAFELYDTLLNSLSHELRTPIATIIGATDNLKSPGYKLSIEQTDELISEISRASFRLNEQVENLLNMSRLETGYIKPRLTWHDISELVYETVKKIEQNDITQKIRININPDLPVIKTDKIMIQQVVYNLLNNATLYTPVNSNIYVSARVNTDILEIVIEDEGTGFPHDEMEHVFDKFYRLKNSKAGGTGLGLSIVQGLTHALKGTVSLSNLPSGGARFIVNIPCETSDLKVEP